MISNFTREFSIRYRNYTYLVYFGKEVSSYYKALYVYFYLNSYLVLYLNLLDYGNYYTNGLLIK